MGAFQFHQIGAFDSQRLRIARMKLGEGFRDMGGQARTFAGAGHGVPLIADTAGIQCQRVIRRCPACLRQSGGDEPRLAIGMVKPPIRKKAGNDGIALPGLRPLKRRHRIIGIPLDAADIEIATAGILET